MIGSFFDAEIFSDAMVEMNDEISRNKLMEIRGRSMVGVSPFFPADFVFMGKLCHRNQNDIRIRKGKSAGEIAPFKVALLDFNFFLDRFFFRFTCTDKVDIEMGRSVEGGKISLHMNKRMVPPFSL